MLGTVQEKEWKVLTTPAIKQGQKKNPNHPKPNSFSCKGTEQGLLTSLFHGKVVRAFFWSEWPSSRQGCACAVCENFARLVGVSRRCPMTETQLLPQRQESGQEGLWFVSHSRTEGMMIFFPSFSGSKIQSSYRLFWVKRDSWNF